MKLVSFKICPFVQRVTALLELKNRPYKVQYINLSNKPAWFLQVSPNGQVPILITEGKEVLFESDAIVEYIEETVPPALFSADPIKKAQDRAWSYLATKHYLTQCSAQRSKDKQTLLERTEKLSRAFSKLEIKLSDKPYFNGDHMGMVDIAWLPLLHRAAIIEKHSGYDFLENFPKVKVLQKNILARGLVEKSVAEDFETKFTSFYLSEETFLGQCAKHKLGQLCCEDAECADDDFLCCA